MRSEWGVRVARSGTGRRAIRARGVGHAPWNTKTATLVQADSIDEAAAQGLFPQSVGDRLEPLLDVAAARRASAWNADASSPKVSGISAATLLTRLGHYVNRSAIESAMQERAGLKDLSGDAGAVLAVLAHQFQQKIYAAAKPYHDGGSARARSMHSVSCVIAATSSMRSTR